VKGPVHDGIAVKEDEKRLLFHDLIITEMRDENPSWSPFFKGRNLKQGV
jgi:hypothetical protein